MKTYTFVTSTPSLSVISRSDHKSFAQVRLREKSVKPVITMVSRLV